jgi:DNA polymerase IV
MGLVTQLHTIMNRNILHMDLDTFFVSVERLEDSRLNNKAVLVGGTGSRGVVSAASYEARKYGAHSGMPMRMAQQLCPEAIVIRGNAGTYGKYSKLVTDILKDNVPILEKASVDEFYADMTGMDKFFGCYKYASELRQKVYKESGLPISLGLSKNKTVSKMATNEAKPDNQMKINFGAEKDFLAPLSIKKIPSVGDKLFQRLSNMGVKQIKTLQEMPRELLETAFGKTGTTVWERANGIDHRKVIEYHERKSISSERTFGTDTIDIIKMKRLIKAMAENLCYQLRNGNKLTSCITVKIRYADFSTLTKQVKVSHTAVDHILVPHVCSLFDTLYSKRLLVRLVGVRFSQLIDGSSPMSLFDNFERTVGLYQAMDDIRNQFGSNKIMSGGAMGKNTIGGVTNPFNGEPPIVLAHRHQ